MAHPLPVRRKFFRLREQGYSIRQAAEKCGISYYTGKDWHKLGKSVACQEDPDRRATYRRERGNIDISPPPKAASAGDIDLDPNSKLCDEAKRGLVDFEFFRSYYLGHVSMPWQIEAANQLIELLKSPDKEFVVVNEPPGSGKTTLVHDIACWLTVRNRRIRGLVGSHTGSVATDMVGRVKDTLERTEPYKPSDEEIEAGLACDAQATLGDHYGTFIPEKLGRWQASKFRVKQLDGGADAKESTWVAYGFDQGWLGGRFNVCFWDDANVPEQLESSERLDKLFRKWDTQAESRLDPGGVMFLVGQRIGANDLYRHALDKKRPLDEEELEVLDAMGDEERKDALEGRPAKYKHIVYKAHYEDRCKGKETHRRDAPPYPEGCLLDPKRLPWRELLGKQHDDINLYATWYQQEDADPSHVLVRKVWIDGGTDPDLKTYHIGCWDDDRDVCQLPPDLPGPLISVATIDPSPTRFWAWQWWVYAPNAGHRHFLLDSVKRVMSADQALDGDPHTGEFSGLMEEWQQRSILLGLPIHTWVMEINAAQRWFFDYSWAQRWISTRGITVIRHTTTMMKSDPQFGISMVREHWKHGRVRLPGSRASVLARPASLHLVGEVTRYPNSVTDDQVMAHWFYFHHIDNIAADYAATHAEPTKLRRPSWVDSIPDVRPLLRVAQ